MATNSTNRGPADFVESAGKDYIAVTDLKPGAVGLAGAIMQNITHIAPAIAAFFFTTTLVGQAGGQAPLAYLVGLIIVIPLGVCLMELARKFPSAGGYFTYVSRTLGPSMGFLTAWVFVLYSPVVAGPSLAVLGQILQDQLSTDSFTFHWYYAVIIGIPLVAWAGYTGISFSIKFIVAVGLAEFLIVLALGLTGLADPGPGGFTFAPFSPSFQAAGAPTVLSGFFVVVVLTVQGLTGWEAAVPLAEETENPRRNVPRSIMASILIIGVMLVIAQWGQVIGWGVNDLPNLLKSSVPAIDIAHRVWGGLWWLTLAAMITSVLGASLACQNVATRMWYSMGRAGVLPKSFGQVHPTRKTPTTAVTAQLILSVVLGIGGPWLMVKLFSEVPGFPGGPWALFIFLIAYVLVLGVIFVYVAANIGVVVYYWTKARDEFSVIKHLIFPVGTSLILLGSIYVGFVYIPLASPFDWTPWVAAVWLLAGIAILIVMSALGKRDWLTRAAAIVAEREDTEHHRPL